PLYIDTGPGGRPTIIAITESNNVYALDALDGSIIWQANVGEPVSAGVPCTVIDPLGITGTPIVDLASRALFLAAMITPDGGTTKKHLILSLNVDTGDINPGWPVDVEATASYNGINFTPGSQLQRAALGIVDDTLYVGYASHSDCSLYHGWFVGVPIDNPASVTAWAAATTAGTHGGAIWGVGGIAAPVASLNLSNNPIIQAAATYRTNQGTYVAYRVFPGDHLGAFRITATNPPSIVDAWSVNRDGCGSPFVTSTDGTSNMIVWV